MGFVFTKLKSRKNASDAEGYPTWEFLRFFPKVCSNEGTNVHDSTRERKYQFEFYSEYY